jgi:hypothetical protein
MQGILKALFSISLWVKRTKSPSSAVHTVHFKDRRKDLNRLMQEISRALRFLSGPPRSGGLFLIREQHEELGRLLSELQRRMRLLDEPNRRKYEPKAELILIDAAKVGITLPPPEP